MPRRRLKPCPMPIWRRVWTGSEARTRSAACCCSLFAMPPSISGSPSPTPASPASFRHGRKTRRRSSLRKKRLPKTNNKCRTKRPFSAVRRRAPNCNRRKVLLWRQAYVEPEHGAIGEISGWRFTVLGGQSPERSILGLDDRRWKRTHCGFHTEYIEGLHNAGCSWRKFDDVSIRSRASDVGHPEIAVAPQKQAHRKAGALVGIERKQLQVTAILLNFKHSLAGHPVNRIQTVKVSVGPQSQITCEGRKPVNHREFQRGVS